MVQCNFKSADPGKIIPTPEQCQTSDHGCLINAAFSYCSASVFSCILSRRHTIQWSGRGSWHSVCGQNHKRVLHAGDGTLRVGRMQVLSMQLVAHTPEEEICLLYAGFVVTRREEPRQGTSGRVQAGLLQLVLFTTLV